MNKQIQLMILFCLLGLYLKQFLSFGLDVTAFILSYFFILSALVLNCPWCE